MDQRVENASVETVVRRARDFGADVVGLSVLTPFAGMLGPLTRGLRAALPKALTVIGGPHVSAFQEGALAGNVADAAVAGEGESALEQLIRAHQEGADLTSIPGLLWRDAAGVVARNPGFTPFVEDVDRLPFPAYDLVDVRRYWTLPPMMQLPPHKYVSLFSSRGCPCRCTYCHQVFGRRFRANSPERVVAEIEHYTRTFGISDIEFLDDIFNLDSNRVLVICDLIAKRNLRLRIDFPNGLRTDALTEQIIDALVEAGLRQSAFALESGSPRMQQFIGKHLDIDKFLEAVRLATDRGVFAHGFAMLGFPTETEADMKRTLDVVCNSRLHTASLFTVLPFPNTELYAYVAQHAPEKLRGLSYDDKDYSGIRINFSEEPDEVLFGHQRAGWRRFYLNPARLARIVRDYPNPWFLPHYVPMYVIRATKGLVPEVHPAQAAVEVGSARLQQARAYSESPRARARRSAKACLCGSFVALLAGFSLGALSSVPPCISLPVVVVGGATACFCAAAFGLSPAKPRWAKLLAGAVMLASLGMATRLAVGYFRVKSEAGSGLEELSAGQDSPSARTEAGAQALPAVAGVSWDNQPPSPMSLESAFIEGTNGWQNLIASRSASGGSNWTIRAPGWRSLTNAGPN
jgi:radical SAM superfamily enzyme YgiQ (UPF0313 family)